jgi:hypothetical protein
MTETMELTQAEKEMIAIKREQEALVKKEQELQNQVRIAKYIADKKEYMAIETSFDNAQLQAAMDFEDKLSEIQSGFQCKIDTWEETVTVKEYNDAREYVPVWSDKFTRRRATIVNGAYTIKVAKHITYSSKWSSRGTDNGFKMYLSGPKVDYAYESKALSSCATVIRKINECIEQIQSENLLKQTQLSAVQTTVEKMCAMYPDAMVTSEKSGESWKGRWEEYHMVTIKFANGITIKYRVFSDGSLGRKDITFPVKNGWELMDAMSKVEFKTTVNC